MSWLTSTVQRAVPGRGPDGGDPPEAAPPDAAVGGAGLDLGELVASVWRQATGLVGGSSDGDGDGDGVPAGSDAAPMDGALDDLTGGHWSAALDAADRAVDDPAAGAEAGAALWAAVGHLGAAAAGAVDPELAHRLADADAMTVRAIECVERGDLTGALAEAQGAVGAYSTMTIPGAAPGDVRFGDGTPGARPAPGERLADDTPAGGPQGDGTSVGAGAPAMAAVDDLDARTDALAGAEPMGTSSGDGSGTDPAMGGYEDGAGVMVAPRASAAMADLERAADGAVVDPAHLVAGLQGMAAEAAVGCVRAADPAGDGPLAELAGRLDRAGDALARGDHAVGVEHLDGAVMVAERLVAATAADAVDDDARVAHDRCAEAVEHRGAGDHDAATRCEQEAAEAYERAAMRTEERMVETAEALAGPEAGAEVRDGVMTAMRGHGGDELAEAATCYREAAARARDGDAEGAMAHDREALVHLARGRAELSAAVDEGRLGPELVEAMGGYPPAMDGPPPGEAADRVERDPLEALDVDGPPPGETADTAMADASERPGEETMAGAYDRSGGGGPDGRGPGDDSSMAFGQGAAPAAAAMAPGAGSPSMPDPPGTPDPAPMRDPMGMPDPMDPAAAMPPMTEPAGWEADEAPMDAGPDPMDVMDG